MRKSEHMSTIGENHRGHTLCIPLQIAIQKQDPGMIRMLLSRGAYSMELALKKIIYSSRFRSIPSELVQLLLEYKSELRPGFLDGMLQKAISGSGENVLRLLLRSGADANAIGPSSFAKTFVRRKPRILEILLEHGADPNVPELVQHLALDSDDVWKLDAKLQLVEK